MEASDSVAIWAFNASCTHLIVCEALKLPFEWNYIDSSAIISFISHFQLRVLSLTTTTCSAMPYSLAA